MTQIIEIFATYATDEHGIIIPDTAKGLKGYFSTEEGAKHAAKGHGWGGSGIVIKEFCIQIGVEYFLLKKEKPIKVDISYEPLIAARKSGLEKLTDIEKRALGLL